MNNSEDWLVYTMCGITGFTGSPNSDLLKQMTDILVHRGPDASGYRASHGINLGNRRLRVIDIDGGDQPIANEDETIWIVYNGEIYNNGELRTTLEQRGHVFRTNTDTETCIHLYEEYGDSFAKHINGIFAFAIWDQRRQRLILGRDPYGVKPLHYSEIDGELVFGSEIKAILRYPNAPRRLNRQSLHLFLNLRYVPHSGTLFQNIHRLAPGHVLVWQEGRTQTVRYWNRVYPIDNNHDEHYFAEGLRHHLREAVRRQMVSDVPLGCYLSGGIDSSTIVALASEIRGGEIDTFTLGFNEPTDELDDASFVASKYGTRHHPLSVNPEPLKRFPEVIWYAEEPKENVLQGFLLAQHARQSVTVALSGLGGDELFAGYQIHRFVHFGQKLHRLVPRGLNRAVLSPLSRLIYSIQNATGSLSFDHYRRGAQLLLASGSRERFYLILRNTWDHDRGQWNNVYGEQMRDAQIEDVNSEFTRYFSGQARSYLEQVLDAELQTKMIEDFLNNEDRVSMANGLEVRVPFLDHDVVKFACSIPGHLKYKNGSGKHILKSAMQGILPQETLRKKKWGFTFNSYQQFTKDLKSTAELILTRKRVEQQGIFNYKYLRSIMDHRPSPRMYWHYFFLWNVLGFTIWHRMFLEGESASPEFDLEAYAD